MIGSIDTASLTNIFMNAALIGGAGITALATAKSALFTNAQQQEALITRFGKHIRTIEEPGLQFKIPFIDKVAARIGRDVVQATETLETKTKDDLFVQLPISIQYEVSDSTLFFFKNRNAAANMMKSVSAAVRTATAGKDFQELYTDRDEISTAVIDHVKDQVAEFGINLRRIIIDEPSAPAEVQAAFNDVRASERLKEAARNKADAEKITKIAESEAAAIAQKNAGQGAADFRKAIFEGYKAQIDELTSDGKMSREEAVAVVTQAMTLDALRDVAKEGNVIVVPQSFDGSDFAKTQALHNLATKSAPAPVAA